MSLTPVLRACPEQLIVVKGDCNPLTKRKEVVSWAYDISHCMFWGLGGEACSSDALQLTQRQRDGALQPGRHGAGPGCARKGTRTCEVREMRQWLVAGGWWLEVGGEK